MSNCKNICRLCDRLVISTAVNFDAATNELLINLPARAYNNCQKYCFIVAQGIPAATTINALVFITIGTGTTRYPLTDPCCQQVTACQIRTRTKYSTIVKTNTVSGVFRLLERPICCATSNLVSLPAPTIAAAEPVTPANAPVARTASVTPKKASATKSSTVDNMTVNASNVTVNKEDK